MESIINSIRYALIPVRFSRTKAIIDPKSSDVLNTGCLILLLKDTLDIRIHPV